MFRQPHLKDKLRLGVIKGGLRCWVALGLLPLAKVRLRSTGSCTPPHNWPKNDANDAFSIRFDNNLGWVSVFVFVLSAAETLQQMNALKGELRVPLAKGHLRATGSCTPPHNPYRHQVKSGGQFRCKRSLELMCATNATPNEMAAWRTKQRNTTYKNIDIHNDKKGTKNKQKTQITYETT